MQKKNINEFFKTDVREFSVYDCQRSLPSGIDGFKPAMRKIIYGMQKEFKNNEIKVSLAAAAIMSVSAYHHGSLAGTIVNMAQSYPGSNNVPFLDDIGQFGSRISPESSAERYIFTRLNENFRKLFIDSDDGILVQQEDDGMLIEPFYYLPIIPTVLLNGSDGMGTGFACKILNYNPYDLILACEEVIKKGKLKESLLPWYRGFTGKVDKNGDQVVFSGNYEIENTTTCKITELPIGSFTKRYREVLNDLEDKGIIKSYIDNSSEEKTEFIVTCPRDTLRKTDDELKKIFKLVSRETENFTVWIETGKLKKFASNKDLIEWFVDFRLKKYDERKAYMIHTLSAKIDVLYERMKFIEFYLKNSAWFSKTKKEAIHDRLVEEGFVNIQDLMGVRIYNLTADKIDELKETLRVDRENLETLKSTESKDMYLKDLSAAKQHFKAYRT